MNQIKVKLLHYTPTSIAATAGRTCWNSFHKGGVYDTPTSCTDVDAEFIDRVINQFHHSSIAEHISMNFFIDGISRACLQEWSRHRHMSQSVESTRYTMAKELKAESSFFEKYKYDPSFMTGVLGDIQPAGLTRAEKYIHLTGDDDVDYASICALENLRELVVAGKSNDIAKYALPECWRVRLTATINLRSLQNFLSLRTDRKALPEIQHLAHLIYESLPADIQSLVSHCVDPVDELAIAKARIAELEAQLGK